jgi:hypothetical protein
VLQVIIAGLALGLLYLLAALVQPVRRCPRCKGKRAERARHGFRPCARCKGHGETARPGARTVHRLLREHLGPVTGERIARRAGREEP